ncbi:MAG TPA: hypothetical protein VFN10_17480 [Thermoanaerobaculia bacterium]|nr:hypothetical protein [Thermoanaerobaculia bacterium]
MARSVAIVFVPDAAPVLRKLAFRSPVWLVDTPANRAAAEEVSHDAVEWPHISITMFREDDELHTLLDQISLREGAVDAIDVVGSSLTPASREVLGAAGFSRVDATSDGLRARR